MQQSVLEKEPLISSIITAQELLDHWQGHRKLTRKLIEAFPEKELFTYSVGGMRPFAELVQEMLDMAVPGLQGIVTRRWQTIGDMAHINGNGKPQSKQELLQRWDETTLAIDELWPQIPANRFRERDSAFGMYEGTILSFVLYFIDNEIHHRGQGYVYLRSLGIEPPPFWERG
jgi:uncharacterized damage-inducible protein DinB